MTVTRGRWTEEERDIVVRNQHLSTQELVDLLNAAGYDRSYDSVHWKRAQARQGLSLQGLSEWEDDPPPDRIPPSRRQQLVDLAETPGLTVAQYERRKAEILKGEA